MTLLAAGLVLCALSVSCAEAKDEAMDPTGTWKWSYPVAPNKVLEAQLKLRMDDGKLAGVAIGPDKKELPIEKAHYKDGQIRFEVTRQVLGKRFTTRYEGTLTGDRIKGKSSAGPKTSAQSLDWEAVRARPDLIPPPAGGAPSPPPGRSSADG